LALHPAEVAYALWFHDAVYELDRHDNEQESANWAHASLTAAGVQVDVAERVYALIMATCHSDRPSSPDAQLVVDIDLAILAASPDRFEEYERQIREEYQHVPEKIFLAKRRAVLGSFLERLQIYLTPAYGQRFESIARYNLKSRI
jgi:predicted metal-dependent HD superfamily phosphohydrolase